MDDELTQIKSQLRIPVALRDRLAAAAKESGRSMNGEILFRLSASFDQEAEQSTITDSPGGLSNIASLIVVTESGETFRMEMKHANLDGKAIRDEVPPE